MDPINLNQSDTNSSGGKGSLIGAIIVIVVLIIGAIYLFSGRTEAPVTPENGEIPATTEAPVDLDSMTDLEAAAGNIDIGSIDADADALNNAVAQ
jgi:uncharacterized protein YpmB